MSVRGVRKLEYFAPKSGTWGPDIKVLMKYKLVARSWFSGGGCHKKWTLLKTLPARDGF